MRKTGKRALALGLCVATAFAMTGCGGKTGETEPAAAAKTESQAAESTTAAAKAEEAEGLEEVGEITLKLGFNGDFLTMPEAVLGAAERLNGTESPTNNIAVVPATRMPEGRRRMMPDFEQRQLAYQAAMALARRMLSKGLISEEQYAEIDTIIANKYGISSCSIFR